MSLEFFAFVAVAVLLAVDIVLLRRAVSPPQEGFSKPPAEGMSVWVPGDEDLDGC